MPVGKTGKTRGDVVPSQATREPADPQAAAQAALTRLVRANRPGRISLAGAYALGYAGLGMAQHDGQAPDWFDDLDPLDTLFLGTVWPQEFVDGYEFANARTAWLRLLEGTMHGHGVHRFVETALAASDAHDLPIDDGQLMLLLAARLEAAGLDQRTLPRALLPDVALRGARFIAGPAPDLALPDPPPNAARLVERLWAGTEVDLAHDGTAADALREGLHLLAKAAVDVRGEQVALLPALYLSLVAGDDERLDETHERAIAWALGLAEDSALLPVVDVVLVAAERGLDVDTTLRHLYGLPAFTEQVAATDRGWHSWPGTALIEVAFTLGHPRVLTRDSKVLRLGADEAAILTAQRHRFEERFGRPPGPGDPLFFDSDADEPQRMLVDDIEDHMLAMLRAAGICPAWLYAHQQTDGLLPRPDGGFASSTDRRDWDDTIAAYVRAHPDEAPDHQGETRKLAAILVALSIDMAVDDPHYATTIVARLQAPAVSEETGDTGLLRDFLNTAASDLTRRLRADPTLAAVAAEYARAWGGAELADAVRALSDPSAADNRAEPGVLFTVAVATRRRQQ